MGLYERLRRIERKLPQSEERYPDNSDHFLDALGIEDIDRYKVVKNGKFLGYDYMKALSDTAADFWDDWEGDEPP